MAPRTIRIRRRRLGRRTRAAAALALALVGVAGVAGGASAVAAPAAPAVRTTAATLAAPAVRATAATLAEQRFDAMTPQARLGQLFMVGCSSTEPDPRCQRAIRGQHVGGVILDGTSTLSQAAERRVVDALQAGAPHDLRLLVSTDQEGGEVRRMRGAGFTDTGSALADGTWPTPVLQRMGAVWGRQLAGAQIDLDLAPVLDTPAAGRANPPIGDLDREYGRTSSVVAEQGTAVLRGLLAGGVATAAKHFPGLGSVDANTDTSAGVTDTTTTDHDPLLRPFAAAIAAGTPFVMLSSAVYTRIDPRSPAVFSRTVVTGLLRQRMGFRGVVLSDDLGAARQVAAVPVGQRAVRFLAAGGDVVLTVEPQQVQAMEDAVRERAGADPAFAAQVRAAELAVLRQKAAMGLLG